MLAYVIGILALIVFFYRIIFLMIPMLKTSTNLKQVFDSFTLLV